MKLNIVKIGSDSVNIINLAKIIQDAKNWKEKTGEKFIIISSGAVKLGKERVRELGKNPDNFTKASLSSIGQKYLMKLYGFLLGSELVGEILVDDFADEKHLAKTIKNLLENDAWIIVNHNDALHSNELNELKEKADNDKNVVFLSNILFKHTDIEILRCLFLTNTNGLLDNEGNTISVGNISNLKDKNYYLSFVDKNNKSKFGTGGMLSKLQCSFQVLDLGVNCSIISNARDGLICLEQKGKFSKFTKK